MKKKIKRKPKKIKEKTSKKINVEKVLELAGPVIFVWILALYFYLCFIPVLYNFRDANIAGKVFMIIGSVAYACLLVLSIWGLEKVNKENTQNKLYRRCSYVFATIVFLLALLHYFSDTLWGYNYTVWGIVLACFFLSGFYSIVKDYFGKSLNSEFKPTLLIGLGLLALFIALVNYDANIPVATIYLQIAIGFGYLIAVALYIYYIFYNKKSKGVSISKIISAVFWAAFILISFPLYVYWWGLEKDIFSTFVTVYSAVAGGGLTLAGVTWTIQHTNKTRQDDRKNEAKPFLGLLNDLSVEVEIANQHVYQFSTHKKAQEYKGIVGNFVNSDKNCFILKKIRIGEIDYTPYGQYFISKEEIFQIKIFEDDIPNDGCKIVLVVEDQNGNEWFYNLIKNGMQIISMNAEDGLK